MDGAFADAAADIAAWNISVLDILFGVIILVAMIRCILKGFIAEFLSVAAIILGIAGAIIFSGGGADLLRRYTGIERFAQLAAFLIIFLTVYLITKLLEGLLQRLFDRLNLERLDRSLGFFLGIIEGGLAVTVIVLVLELQPFFSVEDLLKESFIARTILRILPYGLSFLNRGENGGEIIDV
jgi:membrane protein required for colicin V production